MAPHKIITINGRKYDAVTGLPVESENVSAASAPTPVAAPKPAPKPTAPAPKAPRPAGTPRPDIIKPATSKPAAKPAAKKPTPTTSQSKNAATSVHGTTQQRSTTLARRATKKPAVANRPITRRQTPGRLMDVAKSADVSRFAKHPATPATAATTAPIKAAPAPKPDKPAQVHPLTQRALHRSSAKKKAAMPAKATTAKEVKDAAIAQALATPKPKQPKQHKAEKKHLRRLIIIGSIVLVVILALVAAYKFIPTISVGIASAQAGLSATYPEFTPDGYQLSQPVEYGEGEVILKFSSNSNDNYYTVTQTRSSWDSSAVLDKVVTPAAGGGYVTTKERGLTIYTYESAAVWVNGGILYKIDSKAPLSGDQIRRIATSL